MAEAYDVSYSTIRQHQTRGGTVAEEMAAMWGDTIGLALRNACREAELGMRVAAAMDITNAENYAVLAWGYALEAAAARQ